MLTKKITYTDLNDEEVTEELHFHMSKAELVKFELGYAPLGFEKTLQKAIDAEDGTTIVQIFDDFLVNAYGQKTPDGRRFIKNDTLRSEFKASEAYSEIFLELVTSPEKSDEFVNGVIPKGLAEQLDALDLETPTESAVEEG